MQRIPLTTRALFVMAGAVTQGRALDARWSDVAVAFVRSEHESIKAAAVTLLGEVPHPEQIERLLAVAASGPLALPLIAALGRGGDPRALPVLVAMMKVEPVPFGVAESSRGVAAAAALRHFGDATLTARGARFVLDQLRLGTATWEQGAWSVEHACNALRVLGERAVIDDVRDLLARITKRGARSKDRAVKARMIAALARAVETLAGPTNE